MMKCLLCFIISGLAVCFPIAAASPIPRSTELIIDAAPSIVSYQGSAQAYANFVIAPMGRSLGYIQPKYANDTLPRSERLHQNFRVLDISPVYMQPH